MEARTLGVIGAALVLLATLLGGLQVAKVGDLAFIQKRQVFIAFMLAVVVGMAMLVTSLWQSKLPVVLKVGATMPLVLLLGATVMVAFD